MSTILKETSLLFVEDEPLLRKAMGGYLALCCGRVVCAANGEEALKVFAAERPDVVLTDILMPGMDGIALTERLRQLSPETPVILCSAFSEVPYLLRGIELGVAGFISKPCDDQKLLQTIEKAVLPIVQKRQLLDLQVELKQSIARRLGTSRRMQTIAEQVARIARSRYPVLIQGGTGTGKSRLASIIHDLGPAPDKPFVTVQLSSIPEALTASELFGHERGSFTGADRRREGLVSQAAGGTLFLDDIDATSHAVQGMLLQLVEERTYTPIGSNKRVAADVRIVAASNVDLAAASAGGRFRRDLYYRLAGLVLELPPLREIPEDIPFLAEIFLRDAREELDEPDIAFADDALPVLLAHVWPGNIRELRNVVKFAALTAGPQITGERLGAILNLGDAPPGAVPAPAAGPADELPYSMAAVEQWALRRALAAAGGKPMVAARLLGMNYYTFRRRLQRYSIGVDGD